MNRIALVMLVLAVMTALGCPDGDGSASSSTSIDDQPSGRLEKAPSAPSTPTPTPAPAPAAAKAATPASPPGAGAVPGSTTGVATPATAAPTELEPGLTVRPQKILRDFSIAYPGTIQLRTERRDRSFSSHQYVARVDGRTIGLLIHQHHGVTKVPGSRSLEEAANRFARSLGGTVEHQGACTVGDTLFPCHEIRCTSTGREGLVYNNVVVFDFGGIRFHLHIGSEGRYVQQRSMNHITGSFAFIS